jgi:hypothetical protein
LKRSSRLTLGGDDLVLREFRGDGPALQIVEAEHAIWFTVGEHALQLADEINRILQPIIEPRAANWIVDTRGIAGEQYPSLPKCGRASNEKRKNTGTYIIVN